MELGRSPEQEEPDGDQETRQDEAPGWSRVRKGNAGVLADETLGMSEGDGATGGGDPGGAKQMERQGNTRGPRRS